MSLANNVILDVYSVALLCIISFHSMAHTEVKSLQYKLYMWMLNTTILMLPVDILSRFDGNPGTIYPILNHTGNFLVFLLSPVLPSLWLLYVHIHIFQDEQKTKRLFYPLLAVNAVNTAGVLLSQFTGWFYYINAQNVYHRGPLYLFCASVTIALLFAAFMLILTNRRQIRNKHYCSLLFFAVPPFVSIVLQILFYGVSLILNSMVLSLLVVFLNIQNETMYTDYLTGVSNRKRLDAYLKEKINKSSPDETFSAILIDLNNFKCINDTFGHDAGDAALKLFAKLLGSCLRSTDFIARFGGDEFCIVPDISSQTDLDALIDRINDCIDKYNKAGKQPYDFGFSLGYAVYDYHSHISVAEFQKRIDVLLYKNKQAHKNSGGK